MNTRTATTTAISATSVTMSDWLAGDVEDFSLIEADIDDIDTDDFHATTLEESVEIIAALGTIALTAVLIASTFPNITEAVTGGLSFILF